MDSKDKDSDHGVESQRNQSTSPSGLAVLMARLNNTKNAPDCMVEMNHLKEGLARANKSNALNRALIVAYNVYCRTIKPFGLHDGQLESFELYRDIFGLEQGSRVCFVGAKDKFDRNGNSIELFTGRMIPTQSNGVSRKELISYIGLKKSEGMPSHRIGSPEFSLGKNYVIERRPLMYTGTGHIHLYLKDNLGVGRTVSFRFFSTV